MTTQRIKTLRAFLVRTMVVPPGEVLEVPFVFASQLCAAGKAEPTEDDVTVEYDGLVAGHSVETQRVEAEKKPATDNKPKRQKKDAE